LTCKIKIYNTRALYKRVWGELYLKLRIEKNLLCVSVLLMFLLATIPLAESRLDSRVRVIIGVKNMSDVNTIIELCRGCDLHFEISELNAIVIEIPRSIVNYLSRLPFVRYIEEDVVVRAFEVRWNVKMINATDVWSI